MAKGRVIIDEDRCKGCSLCTAACAQGVLVMALDRLNAHGYHPVQVGALQRCTGCGMCAVICPEVCFTVYRAAKRPPSSPAAAAV